MASDPLKVARYREVGAPARCVDCRRKIQDGRRHRCSAAAPPAAGGRAHLGHRHQNLARLRQLQARRPRAHARHQELQGGAVQLGGETQGPARRRRRACRRLCAPRPGRRSSITADRAAPSGQWFRVRRGKAIETAHFILATRPHDGRDHPAPQQDHRREWAERQTTPRPGRLPDACPKKTTSALSRAISPPPPTGHSRILASRTSNALAHRAGHGCPPPATRARGGNARSASHR